MIGVFDSGLGGLTAVREFDRVLPKSDIVYFGDTARIPYGSKSRNVIDRYALQDCRFLMNQNVSAILVACGTVSSNSLSLLRETFGLPIMGVVDAASEKAYKTAVQGNGTVALLGTSATVKSGAFEKAVLSHGKVNFISKPCPLFVPLAENGRTNSDDIVANIIVKEYLDGIITAKPSAVILGCTHYPLLADIIAKYLPESKLISSSAEAVHSLCEYAEKNDIEVGNNGVRRYFVSDDPQSFSQSGRNFLGRDIADSIAQINIEDY